MRRRALALALLGALAACSVAPPGDPATDPGLRELRNTLRNLPGWKALPGLALAPISLSYLRDGDVVFPPDSPASVASGVPAASAAPRRRTRAELEAEYPETWWKPPLDPGKLQHDLAGYLSVALYEGERLVELDPGRIARISSETLCAAADKERAPLLLHVDVVQARVSWLGREIWWWLDLALLWGGGLLPVVFVPDEIYEVEVTARVTVAHARTGRRLFQQEFTGVCHEPLNHPQRGWSLTGLLGLHPFFMSADQGDYGKAHEELREHALRRLEHEIAKGLGESLPRALERPETKKLLDDGTEERSRTWAIVVGDNGPAKAAVRKPLRFAEDDALAFKAWLLESGTVASEDHVRLVYKEEKMREKVLAAIDDLAPHLLNLDRLVFFYAGYGKTDERGAPVLVLGGGPRNGEPSEVVDPLPVAELAKRLEEKLVRRSPRVVFLLDTSFGPQHGRGRTWRSDDEPGGPAPERTTYLDDLGQRDLGWCVVSAARADETAYEIAPHGFFTTYLLSGLRGKADRSPRDGVVTAEELAAWLAEQVPEQVRPAEQAEQNPVRRGTQERIVVGVVPSR